MINKFYKKFNIEIERILSKSKGLVLNNSISVYWFRGIKNFGDLFTPTLFEAFGFTPLHSEMNHSQIVSTGSILQDLSNSYNGYIFGSGLINNIEKEFKYASILAVRGVLTRDRIKAPKSTLLGDPGLLAELLIKKREEKRYIIGIIPHYVDKNDERIKLIKENLKANLLVINVKQNPNRVISQLDKCNFILSSSLHGLIVADALNIPNGWILLSNKVTGNGFKFYDYASSFNRKIIPNYLTGYENEKDLIEMTQHVNPKIHEIKYRLQETFKLIQSIFL